MTWPMLGAQEILAGEAGLKGRYVGRKKEQEQWTSCLALAPV